MRRERLFTLKCPFKLFEFEYSKSSGEKYMKIQDSSKYALPTDFKMDFRGGIDLFLIMIILPDSSQILGLPSIILAEFFLVILPPGKFKFRTKPLLF